MLCLVGITPHGSLAAFCPCLSHPSLSSLSKVLPPSFFLSLFVRMSQSADESDSSHIDIISQARYGSSTPPRPTRIRFRLFNPTTVDQTVSEDTEVEVSDDEDMEVEDLNMPDFERLSSTPLKDAGSPQIELDDEVGSSASSQVVVARLGR